MKRSSVWQALLLGLALTHGVTEAAATPRVGEQVQNPATKAKRALTPARLAKVRPIRGATSQTSLTYKHGAKDVTLSIGPTSHGPLAFWSVKTTDGTTTTEASTVLDAAYPFATTYRETTVLPNGDMSFEAGEVSRKGYEGVADKDKPVRTTVTRTLSRTTNKGVSLSVGETYRFGQRAGKRPAPIARQLEISSKGGYASFDLLATKPKLTGTVTSLAGRALSEITAFLATPALGLSVKQIEAIIAAVTSAPVVATSADPLADVRGKLKAAMANW